MKLKDVTIHKYKCVETEQFFVVEDDISILVGMNESGKTSILEALAKSNYFQKDIKFTFNTTHDYPRKEKKKLDKSGEDPKALTCTYSIDENLLSQIKADLGEGVFTQKTISVSHKFSNTRIHNDIKCDIQKFIEGKTTVLGIFSKTLNEKLYLVEDGKGLETLITDYKDEVITNGLTTLKKYFENTWKWNINPIGEYISRTYLSPNFPKFLYYDEYYSLPSRISVEKLQSDNLESEEQKTARALFELADINVDELIKAENYEDFIAELEATQAIITNELFKYWSSNANLEIIFSIDKIEKETDRSVRNQYNNQIEIIKDVKIVEHVLEIRVKNRRTGVSLPLKNRSKGFNWFFSFLVWFKKIQEDNTLCKVL